MNFRNYILPVFSAVLLGSCSYSLNPELQDAPAQIVIQSELESGSNPAVLISTTSTLGSQDEHFYPTFNEAVVTLIDDEGDNRLFYGGEPGFYMSDTYVIEEGKEYALEVAMDGQGVEDVFSQTSVPMASEIAEIEVIEKNENFPIDGLVKFEYVVDVRLNEPTDPTSQFQLIPQIKDFTDVVIDSDYRDIGNEFGSIELNSGYNAVEQLIHKNGIFIDYTKLESSTIRLTLKFELRTEDYTQMDELKFVLNTVNQDFMRYHRNVSTQLKVESSPLAEPVVNYTNINDGWGLFAAFSSTSKIVNI